MLLSLSMVRRNDAWLSLTPEPERLLPEARAALRTGLAPPPAAAVAAERARAARLVLGARRRRWRAWLDESRALAARVPDAQAAALIHDVVANHDALELGLPGRVRT
jgi:hypothetical protein